MRVLAEFCAEQTRREGRRHATPLEANTRRCLRDGAHKGTTLKVLMLLLGGISTRAAKILLLRLFQRNEKKESANHCKAVPRGVRPWDEDRATRAVGLGLCDRPRH